MVTVWSLRSAVRTADVDVEHVRQGNSGYLYVAEGIRRRTEAISRRIDPPGCVQNLSHFQIGKPRSELLRG